MPIHEPSWLDRAAGDTSDIAPPRCRSSLLANSRISRRMPACSDVLLFADHAPLAQRLAAALVPYMPVVVNAWQAVQAHAPRARCIVLGDQSPITNDLPARVRRLVQQVPNTPILAVTTPTPEHVRAFVTSGISGILWLHDTPATLQSAVGGAVRKQPLDALGAQLQGATHLPLYLRNTLAYLCHATRCIRTVHELCETAGCHRSTLWAQWRAIDGHALLRLQDIVDWVLLLRACSRHAPGMRWSDVAMEVGVHEHTIGRIAKRLIQCSLRELRHPLAVTVVHDALVAVLAPILSGCTSEMKPYIASGGS